MASLKATVAIAERVLMHVWTGTCGHQQLRAMCPQVLTIKPQEILGML